MAATEAEQAPDSTLGTVGSQEENSAMSTTVASAARKPTYRDVVVTGSRHASPEPQQNAGEANTLFDGLEHLPSNEDLEAWLDAPQEPSRSFEPTPPAEQPWTTVECRSRRSQSSGSHGSAGGPSPVTLGKAPRAAAPPH
ncbi:hypothetical protein HYPSUDRAFT_208461 [Hypholoma sublateritium FD-334 SS-4]|uniref:Uncharacterized protein n=1 Tax=Hypholoma sublateritium (strain FD-334 SS-4) TaxID=945553 RepID=A0A0D2KJC8_HYPSF|nr:hypothetical protein HYPSUDRAFT_208461 [Hypholoma sublateritium FD-334 SS-4]